MIDDRVIGSLRESDTREKIEDSFKRFDVKKTDAKIKYLELAMYSPQMFYSSGENIALKQKYELTLQMFLTGSWKLYPFYEKMGVTSGCVQN